MKFGKILKIFKDHSGTLCAIGAIVGTGVTAYLTAKAAVKVDHTLDPDTDKKLKAKVYAKAYAPAAVSFVATTALIIGSDRIHVRKEVALAGVAALWKDRFVTLNDKAKEKFGEEAMTDIYKDMATEELNKNNDEIRNDISRIEGSGSKVLRVYEEVTGQVYETTYEQLLEGLLECNLRLQRDDISRLETFLSYSGGETTEDSGKYVWDWNDEAQLYNSSYCGGLVVDFTESTYEQIHRWTKSDDIPSINDVINISFLLPPVEEGEWDEECGVKRPKIEEVVEKLNDAPPWK